MHHRDNDLPITPRVGKMIWEHREERREGFFNGRPEISPELFTNNSLT